MSDAMDDLRFALQIIKDSERTIFCSPEYESRIKTMVGDLGIGDITTVVADRAMPDDKLFMVDVNAMDAANHEALLRELNKPMRIEWLAPQWPPLPYTTDPRHIFRITGC
ncbi:MAG TPA: hypothetical protein VE465_01985 [Streptosporangiaceae bacterium]|nr:hypothetical protein [Streptosporangiaceae bacterium]